MGTSSDFVFKEDKVGDLQFVGDFDGYYKNDNDPWGQSGKDSRLSDYYKNSRKRTQDLLHYAHAANLLVVGCGSGHTMNNYKIGNISEIVGADISQEAVKNAKAKFPDFRYYVGDIMNNDIVDHLGTSSFDAIIFEQILWYILEKLDCSLQNALSLLKENGVLIISNAFNSDQRYGKNIIDGYAGAARYFGTLDNFKMEASHFYDDGLLHMDGHFVLKQVKR